MNHTALLVASDIGWGVLAFILTRWPRQIRLWRLWVTARRVSMATSAFYAGSLTVVWILEDVRLVPRWVGTAAAIALVIAYLIAPHDDDDDPRKRKRRRAAWKRVKEWLATGVPAARPEPV